ncbi:MAG: type II toxin-antitoxin system RelE/ParE family toxin [Deltaproteobacteria bacterium]|nr:type II toxin-antitoxin system RelE/ParE family toxin [Deltaproteobacteria bacterium]
MAYQIAETEPFERSLKKTTSPFEARLIRDRLRSQIYPQLRAELHFGPQIKKLRDYDPPTYRYRIGHFRLFYLIDEVAKTVVIAAVRHRKEAYR